MYTLVAIMLGLWLVGVLGHIGGNAIHLFLIVAASLLIAQILKGLISETRTVEQ